MKFWDSSALSCICGVEVHAASVRRLAQADPDLIVWWGARTECLSALARATREGRIDDPTQLAYRAKLNGLASAWREVSPSDHLRSAAGRLVFVHPLRAADAFQLAAAMTWCLQQPGGKDFVCLDRRLREAAQREGFTVLP